ncbi:MAG: hypothetical protein JW795_06575, partial [Chitinivibrionales bacterium]|nr:hypothetical protein [Chitinivibrionales bacterium]
AVHPCPCRLIHHLLLTRGKRRVCFFSLVAGRCLFSTARQCPTSLSSAATGKLFEQCGFRDGTRCAVSKRKALRCYSSLSLLQNRPQRSVVLFFRTTSEASRADGTSLF